MIASSAGKCYEDDRVTTNKCKSKPEESTTELLWAPLERNSKQEINTTKEKKRTIS